MAAVMQVPLRQAHPFVQFHRRLFREKPLGAFGGVIFAIFLFCGLFADVIAPYGVNETDMLQRLESPSLENPFGTDHLGRDVFSRILYGAQLSVIVGCLAAGLATVISIVLGLVTGYFGGKTDMVIQRFVDAWMTFPDLVLLIVVIYVSMITIYHYVMGMEALRATTTPAASVAQMMLGPVGASVIALLAIISAISSINGTMLSSSRVYYAMARDGSTWNRTAAQNATCP